MTSVCTSQSQEKTFNPFTGRLINTNCTTYKELVADWDKLYYLVYPRSSPRVNKDAVYSSWSNQFHSVDGFIEYIMEKVPESVNLEFEYQNLIVSDPRTHPDFEDVDYERRKLYLKKIVYALEYCGENS
jgi:hypothetical protein